MISGRLGQIMLQITLTVASNTRPSYGRNNPLAHALPEGDRQRALLTTMARQVPKTAQNL
jgi:hypothetical protein